jgi:hypothetical protein
VKPLDPSPLRRSTRISKGPDMSDYHFYNSENYDKVKDSSTYSQAIKDFDSKKWISAMNEEFDSMGKNGVWRLVKRHDGMKVVGCKWIFKRKRDVSGILEKFHMVGCLSGRIPYNNLRSLSQKDCPKNDQETLDPKLYPYANVVGSLMYLMICTRPDIAFVVGMVSRFQSNPGKLHWMAIQWIFRYLKCTKGLKLTYHGSTNLKLHGFSNSDYQGCLDSRKSTKNVLPNLQWRLNM